MSDERVSLESLKEDWCVYRVQDDQKKRLIEKLFAHINTLQDKLSEAESELQDKKDVIKVIRGEKNECKKRIGGLVAEKAHGAFAIVLIDGDCMPFDDELVRHGMVGGKKAAGMLKQAVKEHMMGITSAANAQVIIRVFANVRGLGKTYREMGILPESSSLDDFVRGFNMGDALCDYVDAGNGKECSDEKIKAVFRLSLEDVHCQQILFGGTADSGYARLLGPYVEDQKRRERITLIEGPPFASEIANIKDRFGTVSFHGIIRGQKLLNVKRLASSLTPPATPVNYASAAKRAPNQPSASDGDVSMRVLRNKHGERVDSPLHYLPRDYVDLKNLKLCNNFHLLGKCRHLELKNECTHDHDRVLTPLQKTALRAVSRLSPCPSGLECSEPSCILGHRCPREDCTWQVCRFTQAMHQVDLKPVS